MTMLNTKKNANKLKTLILEDLMPKNKVFGKGIESALDEIAAKYDSTHKEGNFKYKLDITAENWEANDKYSHRQTINLIEFYGITLYMKVDESRTGEYHSDFYHSFEKVVILSEKEYNKPKVVYSNSIDENVIEFLDNGYVVVILPKGERQTYINFKSAIKSINLK